MNLRKKIYEITKEDLEKIGVWDFENNWLTPFFFEKNQEVLVPLYHDVVEAILYVKSRIYKLNTLPAKESLGLVRFSNDLYYSNDDYKSLDPWWINDNDKITKLESKNLPVFIKINFETFPFFNNYILILAKISTLEKLAQIFWIIFEKFENLNILLTGEIGSGKTTFTKKIINTTSPTFNLLNSYKIKNLTVNHWDLYRIETTSENLKNIDFWYHLNEEKTINLIEWANKIKLEYYISQIGKENLICLNLSFSGNNKEEENEKEEQRYLVISFFDEFLKNRDLLSEDFLELFTKL
ncbi:MAG: tRNA (adenosine(37)-N6)-threonylcarbamoyltransferase complex ATPase subunit type 1 TsaE [bacterium]